MQYKDRELLGDRELMILRLAAKYLVVVRNHLDRRVQVMQDRVQSVRLSIEVAVLHSVLLLDLIHSRLTVRLEDWL